MAFPEPCRRLLLARPRRRMDLDIGSPGWVGDNGQIVALGIGAAPRLVFSFHPR